MTYHNDLLKEVKRIVLDILKGYRPSLAQTTGALPVNQVPSNIPGTRLAPGSVTTTELSFDPATQAELDAHAADTTSVHGISDTSTLYRAGGSDVALADGGTGASLSDPNADRILFWDDSAGGVTWLTAGTNLTITGTTIAASGGGGGSIDVTDGTTTVSPTSVLRLPAGTITDNGAGEAEYIPAGGGGGMTDPTTTLGDLIVNDGSGVDRLPVGSDGDVLTADSGDALGVKWAAPAGGGGSESHILIVDSKSPGTAGGTFTTGSWQVRDLNTERYDTGGHASVSSNQITLAAGTYRCRIQAPAWLVNQNQARLYDTTGAAVLVVGSNAYASRGGSDQVMSLSMIVGRFTLGVSSVLEVQHQCQFTQSTNGFGLPMNGSFTVAEEVYVMAEFWKE